MKRLLSLLFICISSFTFSQDIEVKGVELSPPTEVPIQLHFAKTADEIAWGFMNVHSLNENECLLFIFSRRQKRSFWMFNCFLNLDLAFLDNSLIIKEVSELIAYPEEMDPKRPVYSLSDLSTKYPPDDPIRRFFAQKATLSKGSYSYALELPYEFLKKRDVQAGWHLFLSDEGQAHLSSPIDYSSVPKDEIAWCEVNPKDSTVTYLLPNSDEGYYLYELSSKNTIMKVHDCSQPGLVDKGHSPYVLIKEPTTSNILYMPLKVRYSSPTLKVGDQLFLKRNFS